MRSSRIRLFGLGLGGPGPPWLWLALVTLVGVVLRVRQLSSQVVLGDEVHSLRALLTLSYADIFGHFFRADICIPLTLLAKLTADTIGLDEISLRLLPLLAGVLTVALVPLLVRRWLGNPATVVFAALLATAPMLVFFSRNARPYAVSVLLVSVAVFALARWMEAPSPRLRLVYVLSSVLAVYFHLLAAPSVIAPLLVGVIGSLRSSDSPEGAPGLRDYLILGALVGCGVGLLLAVPIHSSAELLLQKTFARPLQLATVAQALRMLVATTSLWTVGLFWGCSLVGLCSLWLRQRRLCLLLIVACTAQLAALLLAHPYGTYLPWVFARYNVWLAPFLLLFCAASVGVVERRWGPWLALASGTVLCATLYLAGPIPRLHYAPNNFPNQASFRQLYYSTDALPSVPVPDFYHRLAMEEGRFEIVEVPWSWRQPPLYHHYQRVHRKPVRVGWVSRLVPGNADAELPLDDPRLRFTRYVDVSDVDGLVASDVRYVILHPNPPTAALVSPPRLDLSPLIRFLTQRLGPPVSADKHMIVFEVERLSGRRAGSGGLH